MSLVHSSELLKGTLQTIVLKVLKDHGRMYGYEITQRVKELSEGRIALTEGALYPLLHRLEAEGVVKTEVMAIGKRMRKYYTLTTDGRSLAKTRVAEFKDFVETMTRVLNIAIQPA